MKYSIFILLLVASINCHEIIRRQITTTPAPDDDGADSDDSDEYCDADDDEDALRERAESAALYLPEPMSKARTLKVLERAVDILTKTNTPRKQLCRDDVDQEAKNTLRFLTGDPTIGSTSEDSTPASQETDEFCPNLVIDGKAREVSMATIEAILRQHEKGTTEKSIRGKYPWFRRQYIPRLEKMKDAGGQRNSNYKRIDECVAKKVDAALKDHLTMHDYHIEQWGLECADKIGVSFRVSSHWILSFKKRHNIVGRKVTELSSRA